MRRPSAFDVRRIEIGSNHADFEQNVAARRTNFGIAAAHHSGDAHGSRRVGDHAHFVCERSFDAVERAQFFSGARPPHDDPLLGQQIHVIRVHRAARARA